LNLRLFLNQLGFHGKSSLGQISVFLGHFYQPLASLQRLLNFFYYKTGQVKLLYPERTFWKKSGSGLLLLLSSGENGHPGSLDWPGRRELSAKLLAVHDGDPPARDPWVPLDKIYPHGAVDIPGQPWLFPDVS